MTAEHDRALAEIDALRNLGPDWDSYGAPPINPAAIDKAAAMKQGLTGRWHVAPSPHGGVVLEQHEGGLDIEITIDAVTVGDEHGS